MLRSSETEEKNAIDMPEGMSIVSSLTLVETEQGMTRLQRLLSLSSPRAHVIPLRFSDIASNLGFADVDALHDRLMKCEVVDSEEEMSAMVCATAKDLLHRDITSDSPQYKYICDLLPIINHLFHEPQHFMLVNDQAVISSNLPILLFSNIDIFI